MGNLYSKNFNIVDLETKQRHFSSACSLSHTDHEPYFSVFTHQKKKPKQTTYLGPFHDDLN